MLEGDAARTRAAIAAESERVFAKVVSRIETVHGPALLKTLERTAGGLVSAVWFIDEVNVGMRALVFDGKVALWNNEPARAGLLRAVELRGEVDEDALATAARLVGLMP